LYAVLKLINKIKKIFGLKIKDESAQVLIITKGAASKEYDNIEEAISELEKTENISEKKIGKLRASIKKLQNNSVIKIKDGEIIN
jgi:hypothetical protein